MKNLSNGVKTAAVKKAIVYLSSVGVDFALIYEGQKFGNLELAPKKPDRAPRKDYNGKYNYLAALRALKEGESVTIEVAKEDRTGLQNTICTAMGKLYGAGTYMTATNDTCIEVLRLSSLHTEPALSV